MNLAYGNSNEAIIYADFNTSSDVNATFGVVTKLGGQSSQTIPEKADNPSAGAVIPDTSEDSLYDPKADVNTDGFLLSDNGVEYFCDITQNGGYASITIAENYQISDPDRFYASMFSYSAEEHYYSGIIEGYLTTVDDNAWEMQGESGYLSIVRNGDALTVTHYGDFVPYELDFTGTYFS